MQDLCEHATMLSLCAQGKIHASLADSDQCLSGGWDVVELLG